MRLYRIDFYMKSFFFRTGKPDFLDL